MIKEVPLQRTSFIPSLSENKFLRYLNFIALYLAQGIPEGMCFFGIPAWMAMNGKTPGEIGTFVAAVGLPWSFKIIVAPLMDRFSYLPMGRRRPWVLFGQFGLVASFVSMALVPDPLNNLNWLMVAGFAVGFFGSFQDVATDGMAIDIVPQEQQAKANAMMWGAKIIGSSTSLAAGTWLLNEYGFTTSIFTLSFVVSLIMLAPLCLRERTGEKLLPWTKGNASSETKRMQLSSWRIIARSLYKVFSLPNSLLFAAAIFITQGAFNYMDTILPVFTVQQLGWTDKAYSQFYGTASLLGGILGMCLGGVLIERFGKLRMLKLYCFAAVAIVTLFVLLQHNWVNKWFISGFMIVYRSLFVFTSICVFATAMHFCWKKVSATQFTLYMAISNLGRIVGAKALGPVKLHFSWTHTLLAFGIMFFMAWLLIRLINLNEQVKKVHELEATDGAYNNMLG